jgi:hypothetical protein
MYRKYTFLKKNLDAEISHAKNINRKKLIINSIQFGWFIDIDYALSNFIFLFHHHCSNCL